MTAPKDRFEYLYRRYINKNCTEEELQEFFAYVQDAAYRTQLETLADELLETVPVPAELPAIDWEQMYRRVVQTDGHSATNRNIVVGKKGRLTALFTMTRVAAAIIIIVLCAGGYLLYTNQRHPTASGQGTLAKNDIAPGGNKAILTLANGQTIILDSVHNGLLAKQGNASITKQKNGQLAYNSLNEKPTEILYNTLATPRGGQYQLVLPDGSKVWLNAASSIHYPTAFTGGQRNVEITGEAYFEVEKSPNKPFVVSVNGMQVKVLGTHFNINAYNDESLVRTTLLEGSVLVKKDAATALLKPGEQAQLAKEGAVKMVQDVDLEEVVAWKNRQFYFQGADIHTVMRQLSRWYDVDVIYQNKNIDTEFYLEMSSTSKLSDVLRVLELTGKIKFRIEGKRVIILP